MSTKHLNLPPLPVPRSAVYQKRRKVACPGTAHTNAYVDNCNLCLGLSWGVSWEYVPATVTDVVNSPGLWFPLRVFDEAEMRRINYREKTGALTIVTITYEDEHGNKVFLDAVSSFGRQQDD